jgi:hypothetical protein
MDGMGDILEFRPPVAYLKSITDQPIEALERLSRDCSERSESELKHRENDASSAHAFPVDIINRARES